MSSLILDSASSLVVLAVHSLRRVRLFAAPWTVLSQALRELTVENSHWREIKGIHCILVFCLFVCLFWLAIKLSHP